MGHTTAINWLRKFCERNNLRYVNIHSFRHLNATLLINSGTDVRTVSAALGHSQASTTLRAAVPHNPEEPPLDTRRSQYAEHLIHSLIEQGTPQTPL